MDKGAWWAAVHRVAESRTRLSDFHFHSKDKGKIYSMITSVDSCMLSQILCNLMDCNQPFSSTHGIFQARIPKQVAISSSTGSSNPEIEPVFPALTSGFFTCWATGSCNLVKPSWEKGKIPRAEEVEELRGQGQQADGSPPGYKNHQKYFCLKYSQGYNWNILRCFCPPQS